MADDVVLNKVAIIRRCVGRVREEYGKGAGTFAFDHTRQDAAIMNIQRACAASLAVAQHIVRREKLGVPQSARSALELLAKAGWLDEALLISLKNMVGFRNIAVHEYQTLQLPILVSIITKHMDDFLSFSTAVLQKDASLSL
ncbi:type VII toxin-antitoxin system HepT family RNase toxin [Pseudomonas sp. TE3610]